MSETRFLIAEAVSEYIIEQTRSRLLETISSYESIEDANEGLLHLTGVRCFFPDLEAFEEFRRVLMLPTSSKDDPGDREWGDFQTPPSLASQVCLYLNKVGISPQIIVEPTYGTGNFILAALSSFPKAKLIYGVEIQDKYEWHLKISLLARALCDQRPSVEIELHQDNIFTHRFPHSILGEQDILVIGNPPWVTSAELSSLNSSNLPIKSNIKSLSGLDAKTGKSNFDLGEYVLLRMLELFSEQRGTLAMLCKNAVIKNIVEALPQRKFKVSNIRAYGIDAKQEFGVSVDASLLVMDMGMSSSKFSCQVATLDNPTWVTRVFGWTRNKFVSNIENYERNSDLDGEFPMVWRQGLKHDCSKIMELDVLNGKTVNGRGEIVEVEDPWVYWLLKSSDLQCFEIDRARKKVIVTQHYLGEDTTKIQNNAPKLWNYLVRNSQYLNKRKSSIYRERPCFSIFGVGEYSFKPFKLAISGLYKKPKFSIVLPIDNCPVMVDDTCYFLGFDTYLEGLFTASILNSLTVQQFLQSIVFTDAKRPYTKEVLMRIDLCQAINKISYKALCSFWSKIGYKPRVTVKEFNFEEYKNQLLNRKEMDDKLQISLSL